jgi:hypothetical protein
MELCLLWAVLAGRAELSCFLRQTTSSHNVESGRSLATYGIWPRAGYANRPFDGGWLDFDQRLWNCISGGKPGGKPVPEFRSVAALAAPQSAPAGSQASNNSESLLPVSSMFVLGFRSDGTKQVLGWQRNLDWANWNSKVVLIDSDTNAYVPVRRNGWQTEDSLKMPVTDRLFVVGQLGANSDSVERQQYKLVGRTGIGWKPPWLGAEIQFRTGKTVTNYDSSSVDVVPERMRTFFELVTRWPVASFLNLEYSHDAQLAVTPDEHDRENQDLRLAVPISATGQFHIGAQDYRWLDTNSPTPMLDRMQLYLGLQYKR